MADGPERGELSLGSLDEAVAEVEKLADGNVRTTGKQTFGQIIEHLARTHDVVTGKTVPPKMPFFMRMMIPLIKNSMFNKPASPGFKLPAAAQGFFWPTEDVDVQQALTHLKESVERFNTRGPLEVHPIFGKIAPEQSIRMNCGHCAMHLSFVHPV